MLEATKLLDPITSFKREYAFLSNFYPSLIINNRYEVFKSVEHLFQAYKMTSFETFELVRNASTAAAAKKIARSLERRNDWNLIKEDVMLMALRLKFDKQPLFGKLQATGKRELVEGNTWGDTYWGVCKGKGKNRLGILLMQVRTEMKEKYA